MKKLMARILLLVILMMILPSMATSIYAKVKLEKVSAEKGEVNFNYDGVKKGNIEALVYEDEFYIPLSSLEDWETESAAMYRTEDETIYVTRNIDKLNRDLDPLYEFSGTYEGSNKNKYQPNTIKVAYMGNNTMIIGGRIYGDAKNDYTFMEYKAYLSEDGTAVLDGEARLSLQKNGMIKIVSTPDRQGFNGNITFGDMYKKVSDAAWISYEEALNRIYNSYSDSKIEMLNSVHEPIVLEKSLYYAFDVKVTYKNETYYKTIGINAMHGDCVEISEDGRVFRG